MATPVTLDSAVAKTFIKYARLVAARPVAVVRRPTPSLSPNTAVSRRC
jgi:hypothetical protein